MTELVRRTLLLSATTALTLVSVVVVAHCSKSTDPPSTPVADGGPVDAPASSDHAVAPDAMEASLADAADATSDCVGGPFVANCDAGWCKVPRGCYLVGSPDTEFGRGAFTEPRRTNTLTYDYVIGQYEVTQAEWTKLGFKNPSGVADAGYGDCSDSKCPVGNVNWFEAQAFANALSVAHGLSPCYVMDGCVGAPGTGMTCKGVHSSPTSLMDCPGYRLPTQAEWEIAARAGTTTAFYTGDNKKSLTLGDCIDDPNADPIMWYCVNSGGDRTHVGGGKAPNAFGLYDTLGNAAELQGDLFDDFKGGPETNPGVLVDVDAAGPLTIVFRGGTITATATICRASAILGVPGADSRDFSGGFRLAQTLVVTDAGSSDASKD